MSGWSSSTSLTVDFGARARSVRHRCSSPPPTAPSKTSARSSSRSTRSSPAPKRKPKSTSLRAADDDGPADAISAIGSTEARRHLGRGATARPGSSAPRCTHPLYSDFTDMRNWNDTGVIILDEAPRVSGGTAHSGELPPTTSASLCSQRSTSFLTIGYGTEVREGAESGPQTPTPVRQPIVRRYTTEIGQKLTDPDTAAERQRERPAGEAAAPASATPADRPFTDGYVVGDTSYGYTNNCRYLSSCRQASTSLWCAIGCSTAQPTWSAPPRSSRKNDIGVCASKTPRCSARRRATDCSASSGHYGRSPR